VEHVRQICKQEAEDHTEKMPITDRRVNNDTVTLFWIDHIKLHVTSQCQQGITDVTRI